MNSSKIKKIIAISLCTATILSFAACGKKNKDTAESTDTKTTKTTQTKPSNATAVETDSTQAPAGNLTTYAGSRDNLNPNAQNITWQETSLPAPQVKYIKVNDYLPVRNGPGSSYDQVSVLTRNQQVTVIAVATNSDGKQWYKTFDGYYITANADYVVDNEV